MLSVVRPALMLAHAYSQRVYCVARGEIGAINIDDLTHGKIPSCSSRSTHLPQCACVIWHNLLMQYVLQKNENHVEHQASIMHTALVDFFGQLSEIMVTTTTRMI